jgi:hypothetical protein
LGEFVRAEGLGLGLLALATVLIASMGVTAASSPGISIVPPFSGAVQYAGGTSSLINGCGASTSTPLVPSADARNGTMSFSVNATVVSCQNGSSGMSSISGNVGIRGIDFNVSSTGFYNLSLNWRAPLLINLTVSGVPRGSSSVWAEVNTSLHAKLIDLSTGKYVAQSSHGWVNKRITRGVDHPGSTFSGHQHTSNGFILNSTQNYSIVAWVHFSVTAFSAANAPKGSSATAEVWASQPYSGVMITGIGIS